ncbi:MAG: flagellar filament capping protein FliD [Clostridiales bacterium]|jgi:flagellar hook-associated protein 2|nr:flagellar filament capping protein FliD [Clostridiales bacterium]
MQVNSNTNTSTYTNAAYSNAGAAGIVSGLDTEGMVKSMLQPIQTKIDKQKALQQQLTWKQEIYRDIITKINDFQDKYFSLTSDTCLRSNALFNTMSTTSNSSAVNVLNNNSGFDGSLSVQVAQLASASTLKSGKLSGSINIDASKINFDTEGTATINITLDGVTKQFQLDAENTMEKLASDISKSFGSSIKLTQDGDNWTITAGIGQEVVLSGSGLSNLGFDSRINSVSTNVGLTTTLTDFMGVKSDYSFEINGVKIELNGTDTIKDVIDKVYNSDAGVSLTYNSITDSFTLTSKNTGKGFDINVKDENRVFAELFKGVVEDGFTEYSFNENTTNPAFKAGTNAIVCIDGTLMERTSNIINYNGFKLELKDVTGDYIDADGNVYIKPDGTLADKTGIERKAEITSSRDVEKITSTIKSFVEDYNSLIADLNKLIHEEATYKKYPPLTNDQKKEMSESEITLWNEKAKTGLLRNDSSISSFLNEMRQAMYKNVGSTYVLSQIGIDSSSEWKDYGKLTVDEKKLEKVLNENLEGVLELFNGANGLAGRLNDICNKTANKSSASQGTLVKEAGVVGYASEKNNVIYNKLKLITDRLKVLSSVYDKKKQSYWNKFNAMETQLNSIAEQGSWLLNFTGN